MEIEKSDLTVPHICAHCRTEFLHVEEVGGYPDECPECGGDIYPRGVLSEKVMEAGDFAFFELFSADGQVDHSALCIRVKERFDFLNPEEVARLARSARDSWFIHFEAKKRRVDD